MVIDIYSREIVGHRVGAREVDMLAVELFVDAIARFGVPKYVYADSGAAMTANALTDALTVRGL
ncbi:hypothetical protein [Brevibacterium permense]|uniref:Integrase catalytic domain-containing protein n=1 Tax=Brevibacterium permense TaxID=234834 RepID=A0ABN2ATK8_9MICO|nr:hypothetical protein [Brevibacterium permense]